MFINKYVLNLCSYEERELYEMLRGFQEDFPDGGIYRFQFESFFPDMKMGKNMGDMVFRLRKCLLVIVKPLSLFLQPQTKIRVTGASYTIIPLILETFDTVNTGFTNNFCQTLVQILKCNWTLVFLKTRLLMHLRIDPIKVKYS